MFTSSVVWSVILRWYNDYEGYAYQLFFVSFLLWVFFVAGCFLGHSDSKLHVIYGTMQWEDSLLSYTGSPNLSACKIS